MSPAAATAAHSAVPAILGIQAVVASRLVWPNTEFQDEALYQCWLRPAAL